MLASLVLAGIIAAPLGTAGLLVKGRGPARMTGTWPWVRRFGTAIAGTVLLGVFVVGAGAAVAVLPPPRGSGAGQR